LPRKNKTTREERAVVGNIIDALEFLQPWESLVENHSGA
jgi:hypothetical protein